MKKVYLLSLLTVLFVGLVILIKTNSFVALDTSIGKAVYSIHDLGMVSVLKWIGMLGSTTGIIIVLFIFMIIFAFITKSFVPSVILFSSVLIGNIGNKLLKALIERERPSFVDHMEDGFSFPSGHVMVGLLLFGMIAYYLAGASQTKRMKRTIISSACILLLLIGLSRLIEGEHFLTDVIGGFIAGGIFLLAMIAIDKIVHTKISERKAQKDVAL